ncbi:hypothetical protein JCM10212_002985 [Sporobolomyces blumeae]
MASTRDRVTLDRLSAKHARELLAAAFESDSSHDKSWPSTSRHVAPPRGSLADYDLRISRAEKLLAESWDTVSASSRPGTPSDPLDFLLPTLLPPTPPTLTRRRSASSSTKSSPRKRPSTALPPIEVDASITATRTDDASASDPSAPPRAELDPGLRSNLDQFVSSSKSSDNSVEREAPSTMRQRIPPPWARKHKEKELARQEGEGEGAAASTTGARPLATRARSTAEDLLPADSTPIGGPGSSSEGLLSHHHALQSSLLTDLTTLSSRLKSSTETFSTNLSKDKEVMRNAEKQLDENESRIKGQQERLKGVRGKTRGTTCWTLSVLVVVAAMWVGVFLLIKVT